MCKIFAKDVPALQKKFSLTFNGIVCMSHSRAVLPLVFNFFYPLEGHIHGGYMKSRCCAKYYIPTDAQFD